MNDEEDAICVANSGASSIAILDNQQAWFTNLVPHVRVVHQLTSDDAPKCKQTIFGIFKLPVSVSMRVTLDKKLTECQLHS
jgi:hypothetical protein